MKSKNSKFPSPSDREGALNALRNHKMARSVHTFVRGSTDNFYTWLEDMENDAIPREPQKDPDSGIATLAILPRTVLGKIVRCKIRTNQTVIVILAHLTLIRLGLSLATAARDSVLSGVITAQMIEQLMEGYQSCFDEKKEDAEEFPSPKTVRVTIKEAAKRSWKDLAKERIETPLFSQSLERSGRFQEKKGKRSNRVSRSRTCFAISLPEMSEMKT